MGAPTAQLLDLQLASPASPANPYPLYPPLRLGAARPLRGRVMSLWSVAFLGATPIGGPIVGWVTSMEGARVGLAVGGVSCLVAALFGLIAMRRVRDHRAAIIAFPCEDRLAA